MTATGGGAILKKRQPKNFFHKEGANSNEKKNDPGARFGDEPERGVCDGGRDEQPQGFHQQAEGRHGADADGGAGNPAAQSEDESSYGKPVKIEDPFFQKVRSSAYLTEDKYSKEANVMIEVKNVSGRTLYPRSATVSALNAAGEVVEEESYSNCAPGHGGRRREHVHLGLVLRL